MGFCFSYPLLSSRVEGLPNVPLEAQTLGVPVVLTKVGGAPEAVLDGESGMLVDSSDPATVAAAIGKVWFDERWMERARSRSTIRRKGLFGRRDVPSHPRGLPLLRQGRHARDARATALVRYRVRSLAACPPLLALVDSTAQTQRPSPPRRLWLLLGAVVAPRDPADGRNRRRRDPAVAAGGSSRRAVGHALRSTERS